MRLIDLVEERDYLVEKWLLKKIPELTTYQKQRICDDEIIRFAPFQFMKRTKKTKNIIMRFSIIFMLPVLFILVLLLPFNYFITGTWGYPSLKWYGKWTNACGL
jgi:hypothetical protein